MMQSPAAAFVHRARLAHFPSSPTNLVFVAKPWVAPLQSRLSMWQAGPSPKPRAARDTQHPHVHAECQYFCHPHGSASRKAADQTDVEVVLSGEARGVQEVGRAFCILRLVGCLSLSL